MPAVTPTLQSTVDRFARGLGASHKLLRLHPRKQGNPGNAAALSPAIVLGTIAAFEGFAEDFTAVAMARAGSSFGEIAKKVGSWNNPDLTQFSTHMANYFPQSRQGVTAGAPISIYACPYAGVSSWVWKSRPWAEVLVDAAAWMQVRHCLTHGLTTGWRSEWWPGPLRASEPAASRVLRDMGNGKHSLVIHGAVSCARIYSLGAKTIADAVAASQGDVLDWTELPAFD
ncbi:hypothetical protein [Cellulomonas sp.]|uniref:hypothetical protein n=1 Tax=Cellulomonas sp. TaxID=40001 RepID=UPI003BAB313E